MPGLTTIFEVARRALAAQRAGIDMTGHNIANANTEGYSRQRVDLTATRPIRTGQGLIGTGVTVEQITRLRDRFIDRQIRATYDSLGNASMQQQTLSQVEAALAEPTDAGLHALMTKFFNAFLDLSAHPEETAPRNVIAQQASLLTNTFHTLTTRISELRGSQFEDITSKVDRINAIATELSGLDVQITNARAAGLTPSDALDRRDLLLEELSTLAPVSASEDAGGSMMVSVGGVVIASRGGAVPLTARITGNTVAIETTQGGIAVPVTSGELGGLLQSYNTTLPGYQTQLDTMASALMQRVNTVHAAGYGRGTPPSTGIDFFTGTGAGDMNVNPAILANIDLIAASSTGAPGDNGTALALAGIAGEQLLNGGTQTLQQFYNAFVGRVGSTITSLKATTDSGSLVLEQLDNQRSAVSGVSLDEEMTRMLQYQRAFDAAAKVVSTVDEMFQTILSMRTS